MSGSLLVTQDVYQQLREYTKLAPGEIACFGYATLNEDSCIVDEVFLVPQEVSSSNVEFITEGLPFAVEKAKQDNRINDLRFCWHSHGTHGASFSSTDREMVEKIGKAGLIDWFAMAILNKRNEACASIDFFRMDGHVGTFASQVTVPLDFTVEGMVMNHEEQRIAEIEKMCKKKTYTSTSTSSSWNKQATKDEGLNLPQHAATKERAVTDRDMTLHKKAKLKGWYCYVPNDVNIAYYWDPITEKYEGSAPIPIEKNEKGEEVWAIDLEQNVFDGSAIDAKQPHLVPIEDIDDQEDAAQVAMLEQAEKAGLL